MCVCLFFLRLIFVTRCLIMCVPRIVLLMVCASFVYFSFSCCSCRVLLFVVCVVLLLLCLCVLRRVFLRLVVVVSSSSDYYSSVSSSVLFLLCRLFSCTFVVAYVSHSMCVLVAL